MHPTWNQHLAIRAILNALIGPGEFDRLCLGMWVECVEDGILYVFVPNEDCAAKIEANYSDDLAVADNGSRSLPSGNRGGSEHGPRPVNVRGRDGCRAGPSGKRPKITNRGYAKWFLGRGPEARNPALNTGTATRPIPRRAVYAV
jgi:hypothetical protein